MSAPRRACSWRSSIRPAIPGVSMANFSAPSGQRGAWIHRQGQTLGIRRRQFQAHRLRVMPMREFRKELTEKMDKLHVDTAFARRYLNDGFSGGE